MICISCGLASATPPDPTAVVVRPEDTPKPYVQVKHPAWSRNAVIYEVNVRQYTQEGTFKAFQQHLPRLKELGVDILWLMPIHPIGELNRKGVLGSYYAVKDYTGVNPEFGTLDDFKALVEAAHKLGMKVILDWVANHSAWDNPLTKSHPEWYTKTLDGKFQPTPWNDWDDVVDFDFDQPAMRRYMTEAMKYWVRETGIDGYRCDVSGFIPVDFWEQVRVELDAIKPVFMLAEWESRDLHHKAFDMTYAWTFWEKLKEAAHQKKAGPIVGYLGTDANSFPRDGYRMTFTDNHDKNSWEGTPQSNFGPALEPAIVLTGVVNGMLLVYSGQEAGLDRSLKFFERDPIEWKAHPHAALFRKLIALKHENHALWNGAAGGEMIRIVNDKPDQVVSFSRAKDGDEVIPVVNFSDQEVTVKLEAKHHAGKYVEHFSGKARELEGTEAFTLAPWGYQVLVRSRNDSNQSP